MASYGEGAGLSKTTVSTFPARSKYSPPLKSTPHCAPLLVPTRNRRRSRDAESARAGYHDHGDEHQHGEVEADVAEVKPRQGERTAAAMTTGTK